MNSCSRGHSVANQIQVHG